MAEDTFVWASVWALADRMERASKRCKQVAEDEKIHGYTESAKVYAEMGAELAKDRWWVDEILRAPAQPVS